MAVNLKPRRIKVCWAPNPVTEAAATSASFSALLAFRPSPASLAGTEALWTDRNTTPLASGSALCFRILLRELRMEEGDGLVGQRKGVGRKR